MTAIFPFITAAYAGVFGLMAAVLAINVIVNRGRTNVLSADGGGVPQLMQAIRAHGNFTEYVPLALILIGLVEAFGYRAGVVHGLAGVLLVARVLSGWGLATSQTLSFGRQYGAGLTLLVTIIASVMILYGVFVR